MPVKVKERFKRFFFLAKCRTRKLFLAQSFQFISQFEGNEIFQLKFNLHLSARLPRLIWQKVLIKTAITFMMSDDLMTIFLLDVNITEFVVQNNQSSKRTIRRDVFPLMDDL